MVIKGFFEDYNEKEVLSDVRNFKDEKDFLKQATKYVGETRGYHVPLINVVKTVIIFNDEEWRYKDDTCDKDRWRRHKDNSVWLLETNPEFRKPNSWDDIVSNCVLALNTIGADILSFDVKVQANIKNPDKYQKFIILESNSASSMQSPIHNDISICAQKYLDIIPTLLKNKKEGENNNE